MEYHSIIVPAFLGRDVLFLSLDWRLFPTSLIVSIVLCIFFAFSTVLLAGAEKALFSYSPRDLDALNQRSEKAYRNFQRLLEQPRLLVATTNILLTLFSTGLIILLTYISLIVTWPINNIWWPFLPEIFLVALLMILLIHVIPNALAEKNNVTWTIMLLPGLGLLIRAMYPFGRLMLFSQRKVDETINTPISDLPIISEDDPNQTYEDKSTQEIKLLKGIMKFGSIQIKQIMKPRPDIVALEEDISFDEVVRIVRDSAYSRIPVYKESLDNVIGTLYTKDLLAFLQNGETRDWRQFIRPVFFVPEGKRIAELLIEFQAKQIHQAIVIDEYGATAGLVTLEDILEEIIGEIRDELDDRYELEYKRIDESNYIFEGKVLLNDVYRIMQIKDSPFEDIKGDVDSLGGLVMELSGDIPDVNEEFSYKNYRFKVLQVDGHRVRRIKVSRVGAL